mgnify:CR=1 FL=1
MKKTILFISLLTLCFGSSKAQQVPQFSQNMFNKLANNPGSAGSSDAINATVLHRSQWMGFDGAPTTFNVAVDAPFEMLHGGLGLNIVSDGIGEYQNLGLQLSYAFRTDLGAGQLGLGASAGMFQSGLNGGNLNPADPGDGSIPTGEVSGSAMDYGLGIYYNTQDVYIGLSSLHITEPSIEKDDGDIVELSRHYFLLAGYYHEINPTLSLNPSIYLKSDGSTSQLDINANLLYNNRIWGGVSYRLDEGLVLLTGMNIRNDLRFGLAYDVVLNEIQNNSIEFMLGYSFKVDYDRPVKSYKNPRYL